MLRIKVWLFFLMGKTIHLSTYRNTQVFIGKIKDWRTSNKDSIKICFTSCIDNVVANGFENTDDNYSFWVGRNLRLASKKEKELYKSIINE